MQSSSTLSCFLPTCSPAYFRPGARWVGTDRSIDLSVYLSSYLSMVRLRVRSPRLVSSGLVSIRIFCCWLLVFLSF